jgi:type I restriction-modification system DNA methylase subunit
MNVLQARALVAATFTKPFDRGRFRNFAINLLHHIDESKAQTWNTTYIKDAFKSHVKGYERLGTYTSPENEKLDVLIVYLTAESKLERARTAIRNFVAHHLKTRDSKEAALVAFVSPTESHWRFSYVKMEYGAIQRDDGQVGVQTTLTPARRSSYIVGEGESCHTAQSRFLDVLQETENQPTLAKLENAFSVEAVTKEFFEQYKALFLDLKDELDSLAKKDRTIGTEFISKKVNSADFAKKLMGQIVFLYFLQKKGWLGVEKGREWGDGPRNFLRQLHDQVFRKHNNFFNDVLEPLFYDTLATNRGHDAWCKSLNCRIPFLNGGLFEPLAGYSWQKTDIEIPNSLFSNTITSKSGDVGTGILDVFDRYNFTVNEAEPLEKEVAIDPEMLGKVFENLLGVNERKSKGSFYTPRTIVHYICQESLINYLDTALNSTTESLAFAEPQQTGLFGEPTQEQVDLQTKVRREIISRADLETFIRSGDQASYYEAARLEGTKYKRNLPKSIETYARLLDESLASIAVCDPAIGSGAFPVGMMQEIVRARSALTAYLKDLPDRTAYHFKRHAIQASLYGVDIDPGAVEIAKLRLWLSLVVDEDDVTEIKPLPNLDYKIVAGNSLTNVEQTLFNTNLFKRLEELKPMYFFATDKSEKEKFRREIDDLIHSLTNGKEIFDFEIYFSEIMDPKRRGGFDAVIGNPPYVRPHKLSDQFKKELWKQFTTFEKKADLYVCFIERGINLLKDGGTLGYIVSNGCLRLDSFEKLRKFLLRRTTIRTVVDFDENVFDNAAVKTCILLLEKSPAVKHMTQVAVASSASEVESLLLRSIPQDNFAQNYKSIFDLSSETELDSIKHKMSSGSVPLGDSFEISFGLKTGDDSKFLSGHASTKSHKRLLRGEDIGRYTVSFKGEYVWYVPEKMRAHRKTARPGTSARFEQPKVLVRDTGGGLMGTFDDDNYYVKDVLIISDRSKSVALLKKLTGLLNSTLMRVFYDTSFPTLHVQRDELASLPIRREFLKSDSCREIPRLVDRILSAKMRDPSADVSLLEKEIDDIVYSLYGLTKHETSFVKSAAH